MSDNDHGGEDVAGLFRKFGGDVKGYREFATEPQMNEPAPSWRLVSGARAGGAAPQPAPAAAALRPAPTPAAPPVAAPAAVPVKSLFARPTVAPAPVVIPPTNAVAPPPSVVAAAAPTPLQSSPTAAPAGLAAVGQTPAPTPQSHPVPAAGVRELDILFARLDGEPPPQALESGGSGLLSRWRRPS